MMNKVLRKSFTLALLFFLPITILSAQQDTDFMRSLGKMYVVVAVIAAIFAGIVIFMVYLDRKIAKLEDQIKNHEQHKTTR